jgi:hypothetical protein
VTKANFLAVARESFGADAYVCGPALPSYARGAGALEGSWLADEFAFAHAPHPTLAQAPG